MPKVMNGQVLTRWSTESTEIFPEEVSEAFPRDDLRADDWSDTAKEAINTLPRVWTRGLLYFIVLFTGIVLPWAMLSRVDETGAGRGRIEPQGMSSRLEAATAGSVMAVRVQEGETVQKGQILLELESDALRSELQQTKDKLEGEMNRVSQLEIAKNQTAIAMVTQEQQNGAQAIEKQAQVEQVQQQFVADQAAVRIIRSKHQKNQTEVDRYQKLWELEVVPKVKVVEMQGIAQESEQQLNQALADVQFSETRIKEQEGNRAGLAEGGKLALLKSAEQLKDLQAQISVARTDILQTQQQLRELERQLSQKLVRSPVEGTILQLPFKKPKSFVQMGQLVAQIAPSTTGRILKVQIPSQNSGFLKPGMPVKVKFDAYPYQDYGVIAGTVQQVSPDSKVVEVGTGTMEAFEVDVVLKSNYIQFQGKKIALTLGQTATAEVVVRQRHAIDFILDPFKKLQKDGLSL